MSKAHTELVNEIRLFLSQIGGTSVPYPSMGLLYTRAGVPVRVGIPGVLDIAATVKGRPVWIDAKVGKDKLKPDQAKFAEAQKRAGALAFAAWSVADVANVLRMEGLIDG